MLRGILRKVLFLPLLRQLADRGAKINEYMPRAELGSLYLEKFGLTLRDTNGALVGRRLDDPGRIPMEILNTIFREILQKEPVPTIYFISGSKEIIISPDTVRKTPVEEKENLAEGLARIAGGFENILFSRGPREEWSPVY